MPDDNEGSTIKRGGRASSPIECPLASAADGGSAGGRADRGADDRSADPSFKAEGGIA